MKLRNIIPLLFILCLGLVSCHRIPIGYLHADKAEFVPGTVHFYHTPNPSTPRGNDTDIPWTSLRIQGVSGTNPVNYEFADIKASNGGDVAKFKEMVNTGHLNVNGGLVQITQAGVKMLPIGTYTLSLRVFNDGYSIVLTDILSIEIGEIEPEFDGL